MSALDIDFARMFEDMPAAYTLLDMDLRFTDINTAYLAIVGRSREDLIGKYIFDAFPEIGSRLKTMQDVFEGAVAGQRRNVVREPFSIATSSGGMIELYWTLNVIPVFNSHGKQCGILQRVQDVTSEVKAERMRDIVLKELDHRVKNHLATISAIARRTASAATDTESFLGTFEQRIGAMARTHQLLVNGQWDGLTINDLVNSALQPYCDDGEQNVALSGPSITLTNAQAQSLGLALHELTTNAAKYGALGNMHHGRLDVTWDADAEERTVTLDWRESGLHDIVPPSSNGFGSIILDRILPAELNAQVTREFRPDGISCQIVLPSA